MATAAPRTLTVQTKQGSREIPAVWVGDHLAVHRPVDSKQPDGLSQTACWWSVTHRATGLLAHGSFDAPKAAVIALAKLWDAAFEPVTAAGNVKGWPLAARWIEDCRQVGHRKPPFGPREITPLEKLETASTAAELQSAVWAAMGYPAATEAEAAEPFPVAESLPADQIRTDAEGWPEVRWRGRWWPAPTLGEVEFWCLDSVAETPDGRNVEPDHPESWPHILGMI